MAAEPLVQWVTASPLWNIPQQTPAQIQQPAILRFVSDTFMEDLAQQLQNKPQGLSDCQAVRESFRELLPGETGDVPPPAHLKLYQPTHGHFCLIAANLVCRIVGLPDKVVDTTQGEKVGFVLRRFSVDDPTEYAWISTPEAPNSKTWYQLPNGTEHTLADQEELLPLFPVNFVENRQRRRLLVGLIPTSSRESFKTASTTLQSPFIVPDSDPRMDEFDSNIIEIIRHLQAKIQPLPDTLSDKQKADITHEREKLEQEASLFVLLDFAAFLSKHALQLWQAVDNLSSTAPTPTDTSFDLYDLLNTASVDGSSTTWRAALHEVWIKQQVINGEISDTPPMLHQHNLRNTTIDLKALGDAMQKAIPYIKPKKPPEDAVSIPKLTSTGTGTPLFILRCVYQRTHCSVVQNIVSEASASFEIASFFDFDAPTRPIRISLPVDTSIANLRKFKKNVSFVISNQLRHQMASVTNLKSVIDGNIASGEEFDLGVICSFAIPIITICALLVLMIFLVLLNIVFWWLPFVRICFPIPLISKK